MTERYNSVLTPMTKLLTILVLLLITGSISQAKQLTALNTLEGNRQQYVTVKFNDEPLADALLKLTRQVKVGISYSTQMVPDKRITYQAENEDIYQVLNDMLEGTSLYATLSNNRKVILIKEEPMERFKYQETVTGIVTDANTGEPLPGVTVLVVGTTIGAATDTDGFFRLNVPSLQDTLQASFIGYRTHLVPINGRTTVNISLQAAVTGLDEMVVVGFGTQSRRSIVGSVTSINEESMGAVATSTIDKALQGAVPGVQVTAMSGVIGAPMNVRVRGTSSINASSEPLFVIDGVPMVTEGVGGANPLVNLNADDIKSMEILKDATATAVYGARGANGVILITTKRGEDGATKINISLSGGFSNPVQDYEMMNAEEFLTIHNYKEGTNLDPSDYPDSDWMGSIMRTGSSRRLAVGVSGGNKNNQYFISGFTDSQKGYLISNGIERMGLRMSANQRINDEIRIDYSLSPSYSIFNQYQGQGLIANPFTMAVLQPPTIPILTPNGDINSGVDHSIPGNEFSPFAGTPYGAAVGSEIDNRMLQVLGNIGITYDIMPNLSLRSAFGTQYFGSNSNANYKNYTNVGYPNGQSSGNNRVRESYNWQTTLNYNNDWDVHSLQVTAGATFDHASSSGFNVTRTNIPSNQMTDIGAGSELSGGGGSTSSYRFQNNFARVTYMFKDRYIATTTGSLDGTSRFASGNRYGFFPSLGLGWILSEEDFIKDLQFLNYLKLHASYGVTGNANIGNFQYQGLIGAGYNYANLPGFALSQIGNTDLGWERSEQLDISLDYGILDGRLSGTIGYYSKVNDNLLLSAPVSNINGFTSMNKNLGKIQNTGFEFSVTADLSMDKFTWRIFANASTNKNEVLDLPGGTILTAQSIVEEGQPLSSFYLPVYKGVDPSNGDALYDDGNGGVTSSYGSAPKKIAGNPFPDYFGGFGTNIGFKGFDANVNFQYSYGAQLYWELGRYIECNGCVKYNSLKSQLDFWRPDNTDAKYPEVRKTSNGNNPSTRFLSDASYLRLGTLDLGYTIPFATNNTIRLYVQGHNLFTITNFKGTDPDGFKNAGSNIAQGYVYFSEPQTKTWMFGVQIKL